MWLVKSLWKALARLLSGVVGAWCIMTPLILIFAGLERKLTTEMLVGISAVVGIFYAFIAWKWWREGFGFVKSLLMNTLYLFAFAVGVGGLSGVLAAFTGIELYKTGWFVPLLSLLGFWFLEFRREKSPTMRPVWRRGTGAASL